MADFLDTSFGRAVEVEYNLDGSALRLIGFLEFFFQSSRSSPTFEEAFRDAHDRWLLVHPTGK